MNVYSTPQYDDFTGFTFNGQHSSQFGLLRVSNGDRYEDTLVLSSSDEAADIPGGPGQYYWGETLKPREFNIKVAYDNVSEVDKRRIKQWLHPDDKLHELIFDERPYVKYWVKCNKEVIASELCFRDGNGGRVYKGEFSLSFIAYMPYGIAVGNTIEKIVDTWPIPTTSTNSTKKREEKIKKRYNNTMNSIDEWKKSSGILNQNEYNEKNNYQKSIDEFYTTSTASSTVWAYCNLYNPGDINTDFTLEFNSPGTNRCYLTYHGTSDTSPNNKKSDSYIPISTILNKNSSGTYAILKDGKWIQIKINKSSFPNVSQSETGVIVTESNISKFESTKDGQIYDIYEYDNSKKFVVFLAQKNRCDINVGSVIYVINRKTRSAYKFEVKDKKYTEDPFGDSTAVKLYMVPIDLSVNQVTNDTFTNGVGKIWGDIAKNSKSVLGISLFTNSTQAFSAFNLTIPGAATTLPSEWSEAQKSLFYSSDIKIDTSKQSVNCKIDDDVYGIHTEWFGINGIVTGGKLFKIPLETSKKMNIQLESTTMRIKDPTINYTYLYK